ncbi:DNA binding domain-containing protein, excisionase family [Proteiniborus ethanoligenes]|uniref:DNA binding domain-containing protein, excisionase family n=1 Tax=Proteiniborus ethanoligenes TaxID=415015 RepID=A0A1H3S3C1_9FIRM|nr:DNA binding domain-containing protein, excisionase family [Proteiniborus ethanoligenes]
MRKKSAKIRILRTLKEKEVTKEDIEMFSDYPDVVDVEQMSEMLGISIKTGYKLLKENKIQHFKIGRTYKVPKHNILFFMKSA